MLRKTSSQGAVSCLVALLVSLSVFVKPVAAIMASPENIFRQASMTEFFSIREITKLRPFNDRDPIEVSISDIGSEHARYLLVRFCNFKEEKPCPTAFFINGITDESFHGLGLFPAKASWSDRIYRTCEVCGEIKMLVFFGPEDSSNSVGFSPNGIFF
ncbi:hypothetical protein [Pelagibius sp. Alg239-R121]|uniref:hypothetical protein n=1 Tax=Pelagibius sp. Alg239-R121 TaxID=2993448 RepID=UPI0024A61CBA|nr:hypothetical protein [Pelagibius sp. Alg239-R121]